MEIEFGQNHVLPPVESILSSVFQNSETIIIPYYDDEKKYKKLIKKIKKIFENLGEPDEYKILDIFINGTRKIGIIYNSILFIDIQKDYIETEVKQIENFLNKPYNKPKSKQIIITI